MTSARRHITLCCAAAIALTLSACGGSHHHAVAATSSATPTPSPTHTTAAPSQPAPVPVNPFTGGTPSGNRVVAVKIDDTANGRPQVNINLADIVYIEQVEGGLTRLVAVYDTSLPVVEAVRSTRANDPELLGQYGPIAYVASGGAPNPLAVLDNSALKSSINDRGGPGFARDPNREVPYNLTANLSAVAGALKTPKAKDIGLQWGAGVNLSALPVARTLRTVVGSTAVRFDWVAPLGKYVRVIDGVLQRTAAGTPIATPNVIVQFCAVTPYPQDTDVNGNPSQFTHSIGSGRAVIFRGGHLIDGTWSRASLTAPTLFKSKSGTVTTLAPGGAWVVLVATGTLLTSS
ncbi:MAG: DUF3048 domain-containing protein [Actinomycetota bacterium]|nr:DUF3048 domain-containing protein [Actinomycetota bacterium]